MECSIQTTWTVKLSSEQLSLISRALRGCLRDAEIQEAKTLGDEISLMRAKYIQHLNSENEKLIRNLGLTLRLRDCFQKPTHLGCAKFF